MSFNPFDLSALSLVGEGPLFPQSQQGLRPEGERFVESRRVLSCGLGPDFFDRFPRCCIATTGSLARGECSPYRPTELVVICRSANPRLIETSLGTIVIHSDTPVSTPHVGGREEQAFPQCTTPSSSELLSKGSFSEADFLGSCVGTPPKEKNPSGASLVHTISEFLERLSPTTLQTIEAVQSVVRQNPFVFDRKISIHVLDTQNPMKLRESTTTKNVVSPNRALETCLLVGAKPLLEEYFSGALARLRDMNAEDRASFRKHLLEPSKKVMNLCINGDVTQGIDINKGVLFFNNDKIHSTKYVLLRPVQYHLMNLLAYAIHEKSPKKSEKLDMNAMPLSVTSRIQWMYAQNLFPSAVSEVTVQELCFAYQQALNWYTQSQEAFFQNRQQTINVNVGELQMVARIIQAFTAIEPAPLAKQEPILKTPPRKGMKGDVSSPEKKM